MPKTMLLGIVALALSLALSGCTAPVEATPSTPASNASSATSSPVKTQTGPNIAELRAVSPEAFNTLPRSEKMVLIKDMLVKADAVFGYYVAQGTDGMSEHNPLNSATANDNAEETMKQLWYAMQMPYRQTVSQDPDDTSLDRPAALKALNAAFYYVDTDKSTTGIYEFMKGELSQKTDIAPISYDYTDFKEVAPLHDAVDNEGNPIKMKTISLLDKGIPHTLNVVFSKIDDTHSIWQIYDEV